MTPDLPDLQNNTDVEIVADNLQAVGAIYAAYRLEELGMFRVLERIVELFRQGLLPLGQGRVSDALFHVARPGEGMSARDRAAFYAKVLGAPGGDGGGQPNREFLSLWLRFVVAVSMFSRQRGVAGLVVPATPTNAALRAAARALAANASAHGSGVVQFAARELAEQVQRTIELLNERELLQAFGARDMWQVIDQVNRDHLGAARNSARYRTQASAGQRIFDWLADHGPVLRDPAAAPGVTPHDDAELAEAVEQWLAASAGQDDAPSILPVPGDDPRTKAWPLDLQRDIDDLLASLELAAASRGGNAPLALRGVVALFQGARGTGKTLAAHVLAQALSLDLLRVDLAQVVSKYLGETEKHLNAVFERAERAGAILFLDEADALFSKRTEVKDAHDRYANAAINYLLQRIASYEGPVVLATNLGGEIDAAFTPEEWRRRVWRVVRFPRPRR